MAPLWWGGRVMRRRDMTAAPGGMREAGLTLVELIVVMVIIAIVIGAGFLGLLSWLGTDNVNVTQARVHTALQATMANALTNPPAISTTYGNWSLQLVTQGSTQELYVCTGSHGGCAGNTNPANGPVEVHVSSVPLNVHVTINGAALGCLAFSPLGLPLLAATTPATAAANACYWPTAVNGEWTFQSAVGSSNQVSSKYVF